MPKGGTDARAGVRTLPPRIDRPSARRLARRWTEDAPRHADAGDVSAEKASLLRWCAVAAGIALIAGIAGFSMIRQHAAPDDGSLGSGTVRLSKGEDMYRRMNRPFVAGSLAALTASLSASAQIAPVQWRVADGGNGHWYAGYVGANPSWTHARTDARTRRGDLVSYSTVDESNWVYANVASSPSMWNYRMGPWIGLYQPEGTAEPGSGWMWCDGQPMTWTNWMPDHPHNGGGGGPECDHAKYISWPPQPMNQWGSDSDVHYPSYHWEANRSWIVEWSDDCNGDGIVDFGQLQDGTLADANSNGVADVCERFRMISLAPWANFHRTNGSSDPRGFTAGATYPTGTQQYDGIPVTHGADLAYGYSAIPEFNGGQFGTLTVPVNQPSGLDIHLAMNIWARWPVGSCDPNLSVFVTINMDDGSQQVHELRGGEHLRDHNQSWTSGGICAPSAPNVREVWRNGSNQVIDLVTISVPSGPARVESVTIESVDFGFWAMVLGVTLEPTADCNGDGLPDYGQLATGQLQDLDFDGRPDQCQCWYLDLDSSGAVDGADLSMVLRGWGPTGGLMPRADIDRNGAVDGLDLAMLLAFWGPCN